MDHTVLAQEVTLEEDSFTVHLNDGRAITVPLAWYPRLLKGTKTERTRWELIGLGEGIHWPDLDEDISVKGILAGRKSMESNTSLARWMANRPQKVPIQRKSPKAKKRTTAAKA